MNRSDMTLTQKIREDAKKRTTTGPKEKSLDALISDTRKAIRNAFEHEEAVPRKRA